MLPNAGIHFPSHGSKIRSLTSYDMSLGMQWMALTCRATFSGPYGLRIIPFGVLMHGKCENPTTRHLQVLTQSTVSGIGVSQQTKNPKTRKPRQTWKRLFSQPTRKVRMLCDLLSPWKLSALLVS